MEAWQVDIINNNITDLIENTTSTICLKAWFIEIELISTEEESKLTSTGKTESRHQESFDLYQILKGRIGGFQALLHGLERTSQTGALNVLKLARLEHSAKQLLKLSIKLNHTELKLQDFLPKFTHDDALEVLRQVEVNPEIFEKLANDQTPLYLGGVLPKPQPFYIPRSISNRLVIPESVFRMSYPDVFVFAGVDRSELSEIVEPYAVRSSEQFQDTDRHIYLEEDTPWEELVDNIIDKKTPLHLITKEGENFVLQRSTNAAGVFLENSLEKSKQKEAYISEDSFINQIVSDKMQTGTLLCDVPGMGKTWFMQSIARKYQEIATDSVVFFIDLSSFSRFLGERGNAPKELTELQIMLNYASSSKLSAELLYQKSKQNVTPILFVLDGFDEISDDDVDITTTFLLELNSNDSVSLIISSRPQMRRHLEKTFNLISYDILPFGKEEQVRAILNHWTHSEEITISDENSNHLEMFAINCVQAVKQLQHKDINNILGLPLKCYLLALVNEPAARKLSKQNQYKRMKVDPTANFTSISDLYKAFEQVSLNKIKMTQVECVPKDLERGIRTFHIHKALELLFPQIVDSYMKHSMDFPATTESMVAKVGLMLYNRNNDLEFTHRSFAEYYAGLFFAEFWINAGTFEPTFKETVCTYFITHVMTTAYENLNRMSHQIYYRRRNFVTPLSSKTVRFRHSTVMWFVNSIYHTTRKQSNRPKFSQVYYEDARILHLKTHLMLETYVVVLACLDEDLPAVLSLYVQLLKSLLEEKERRDLIHPSQFKPISIPLLLYWVALKGSLQATQELFKLFSDSQENYLKEFCINFPDKYWSPLEVAILRNDFDMVMYFAKMVKLPWERLRITYLMGVDMTKTDIEARVTILARVPGLADKLLEWLSKHEMKDDMENFEIREHDINVRILSSYAWSRNVSLNTLTAENKTLLLKLTLPTYNDEEFVQMLLLLFGLHGRETILLLKSKMITESRSLNERLSDISELFLQALNVEEAQKAFMQMNQIEALDSFHHMNKKQTLKILTGIVQDFAGCNSDKRGYLHIAVEKGKVEWVKHLLKSGHNVNQRDYEDNTPLHCISFNQTLEIIGLLLDNKADVYAVNNKKQNIAHILLGGWKCVNFSNTIKFTALTLANDHNDLWSMKDEHDLTPLEILSEQAGYNHKRTMKVRSILNIGNELNKKSP